MKNIIPFTKTKLPFGWFGNMSPFPIEFNGQRWLTSEALFQSLRFDDESIKESIRSQKSPMGAKLAAKGKSSLMVIDQLSEKDIQNMIMCIKLKVDQHQELKQMLLDTDDSIIIEDVTSRGKRGSNLFWGAMLIDGEWVGENILGKIWMDIREELK